MPDIVKVQLLLDLSNTLLGDLVRLRIVLNFEGRALLEEVILLFASQAKLKAAACAKPKVLRLVNFSGGATFSNWAPAEIIHTFDSLAD